MATCKVIVLPQPEAGKSVNYEIPTQETAQLSFGADDISGLRVNEFGALEVAFTNGGSATITNFQDMVDGGNLLYLNDGTLVDPTLLTAAISPVQAEYGICEVINVAAPDAGVTREITMEGGNQYILDFAGQDAQSVETNNGNLTITFADGGVLIVNNYDQSINGDLPAELGLASGETIIAGEQLLVSLENIADAPSEEILAASEEEVLEEGSRDSAIQAADLNGRNDIGAGDETGLAYEAAAVEPASGRGEDDLASIAEALQEIEPAAGDTGAAGGRGGFGFGSTTTAAPLGSIDDIGPINPTQLQYDLPIFDDQQFIAAIEPDDSPIFSGPFLSILDETNLSGGNLVDTGQVLVNFGEDGPGTITPSNNAVVSGSFAGTELTSGGVKVDIVATQTGYVGTAAGKPVFDIVIDPVTGEYTYTQTAPFDNADPNDPNDEVIFNFGVNATDADGDVSTTTIEVRVADDAPLVLSQTPQTLDETDFNGNPAVLNGTFAYDVGQDVNGTVTPSGSVDITGSVAGTQLSSGGQAIAVTPTANGYEGLLADGTVIFTLVIDSTNGDYVFTQNAPLDHADGNNPDDVITLKFGAKVTDFDGDSATGAITINVRDDAPILAPVVGTTDETDLPGGASVSGTIGADFGEDGPGSAEGADDFASSGSQLNGKLTHNGVEIIVDYDSNTNTYTGKAGNETIFTMTVNADGTYKFDLLSTLDHADPNNPNDIINLDFGVQITDFDGDSAQSFVRIQVKDDVPVIGDSSGDVDETNFDNGPLTTTDTIDHNFGLELGSIEATGTGPTGLTTNGTPVVTELNGNTFSGSANGVTVFTLTVDSQTGEYTYTQFVELDHPNTNDPDDVLALDFGVLIRSNDGSTDTGTITINVADDGPVANDDINGAEEGQLITGDVIGNDEFSEDNPNTVTNVRFGGTDYPITAGGDVTISTTLGTLVMSGDGTYTYTTLNNDPNGVDQFTYTLKDNDGDTDTAKLSITVTPDGQPVAVSEQLAVDETNLTPGPMIFNEKLDVDFGIDGAGTIKPNNKVSEGGSLLNGQLTSGGVDVDIAISGNKYVGTAGNIPVFELEINNDGTYMFQLFEHIDHADNTDPNDIIKLDFGVTIADADNDTADGTIEILIYDDAPVAFDDAAVSLKESETVTGNVTFNDELSEDRPNDVVVVRFNGQDFDIPANGLRTVQGNYGTLKIAADGTYSYTAKSDNPQGTDTFTYVLEDFDGDRDTAEFSFNVDKINDKPIVTGDTKTVDETAGFDTVSGKVNVNYGGDAPGEVCANKEFSASDATLTSNGQTIVVEKTDTSYVGKVGNREIFKFEITADGSYSFTQFDQIDHPDANDADDVVQLNFGIKAVDGDGDRDTAIVTINVKDDGPIAVNDSDNAVEGQTVNGNVITNDTDGADAPGKITMINGETIPVGGKTVIGTYGTLTIKSDGSYSYKANDNNPDGVDTFTYKLVDADGDTDTAKLNIRVTSTNDVPVIVDPAEKTVDETDLGPVQASDKVEADFFGDGPGTIMATNTFSSGGSRTDNKLTSNGVDVKVTLVGDTYVGKAGSATIFTLKIEADGDYTFNLYGNLDHADGNDDNDIINLNFGVKAVDADGDASASLIRVNIKDDVPTINTRGHGLYERHIDDNGVATRTGMLTHDYGEDGKGTIDPNGNFNAKFQVGGPDVTLSSGGVDIVVTKTTDGYIGKAGDETVFDISINDDAEFVYKQYKAIDHPIAGDSDDVIWLKFGVTITDADGDTDTAILVIDVHDDGPDAVNDGDAAGEGETVTGSVIANDAVGADAPGKITMIDGQNIPAGGLTVVGTYGTLTIQQNGSYSYTANSNNPDGVDAFTYKLSDYDGDTDTAILKITVSSQNDVPVVVSTTNMVDETGGFDTVTGTVNVDFGGDTADMIMANDQSNANGLSSLGQAIVISLVGNVYTGTAGGRDIFTMQINGNGSYSFTQLDQIDHPVAGDPNDVVELEFGVKALDTDGDVGHGTITITVKDDGPDAVNDGDAAGEGETVTGSVIANDAVGADAPGKITMIDGQNIPAGGLTVVGTYGTLTIQQNGSYSYTANSNNPDGVDAFTYKLSDYDGDTDTAILKITVSSVDSVPIAVDDRIPGGVTSFFQGNLLDNDNFGQDGRGSPAVIDGVGTYDIPHGTLIVNSDGTYSLSLNGTVVFNENYELRYTIQDADGDTDTAILRFSVTPLVFDLDGDGVEFTTVQDGVLFDYDVDGEVEQTAWLEADDGFLVLDRNEDGIINDRSEMFGDLDGYADGFSHLASMDSDGDNQITAVDEGWKDLRIWRDLNQDGVSDSNELFGLDELAIASINVDADTTSQTFGENYISHESTFTTTDGEIGYVADAHFDYAELNADDQAKLDISNYLVEETDVDEAINDFVYQTDAGDTELPECGGGCVGSDLGPQAMALGAEGGISLDLSAIMTEAQKVV